MPVFPRPVMGPVPQQPIVYLRQGSRVMPPSGPLGSPIMQGPFRLGQPSPRMPGGPVEAPEAFHKGGLVRKTKFYKLKKGEHVIAAGKRKMTNRKPQKMVSVGALKGY